MGVRAFKNLREQFSKGYGGFKDGGDCDPAVVGRGALHALDKSSPPEVAACESATTYKESSSFPLRVRDSSLPLSVLVGSF